MSVNDDDSTAVDNWVKDLVDQLDEQNISNEVVMDGDRILGVRWTRPVYSGEQQPFIKEWTDE